MGERLAMNLRGRFLAQQRRCEGQESLELGEIDGVFSGSVFMAGCGSLIGGGNSGSFTGQTVSKTPNFG